MKVFNVSLVVKENCITEYEQFIEPLVTQSKKESGNISYNHFKQLGANNRYAIIEHWQDQNAVDFHNETTYFKEFLAGINQFVTEELQVIVMDA